ISRMQRRELETRHDIVTLAGLAAQALPLSWRPKRGSVEGYTRAREQARVQREGREAGRALHELLPLREGFGLERLPEPSAGDVFFDLEGDPFVGSAGREYLFGYAYQDDRGQLTYDHAWG